MLKQPSNPNSRLLGQAGSSLYYAFKKVPTEKKEAMICILQFAQTIKEATNTYKEADVTKKKIAWWQNEIIKLYHHQATHPLAIQMHPIIQQYQIPQQFFSEYLEGAHLKIDCTHYCTRKDFEGYSYRENGIIFSILSYILSDAPIETFKTLQKLALSLTLIESIHHYRYFLHHDKQLFTLEDMEALKKLELSDKTLEQQLFKDYALWARQAYECAKKDSTAAIAHSLSPLFLYVCIELALLKEIEQDNFQVLHQSYHLTPLRKWWIAYTHNAWK
jgi:15-cis-phytoene synthase